MRRSLLSVISAIALFNASSAIAIDNLDSNYVDPRFGRAKSNLYDLVNEKPEAEMMFWLKDSLFNLNEVSDKDLVRALYQNYTKSVAPPLNVTNLSAEHKQFVDVNTLSLLTYLFKHYFDDKQSYTIPFVVNNDHRQSKGYAHLVKNNLTCNGMTPLEAKIKQKCNLKEDDFGFLQINYQKTLGLSLAKFQLKQILDNGINEAYSHKLLKSLPNLLGFTTNVSAKGFAAPLSSLDKNLYSHTLKQKLKVNTTLEKLKASCSLEQSQNCELYFGGENTNRLFVKNTNDPLKRDQKITFDNIQVLFDKYSNAYLNLRNTILSNSSFINYGFYTLAELNVLKDLGYELDTEDFVGTGIYQSGTNNELLAHDINKGFYAFSDTTHEYQPDKPSKIPLSIGTHVYGNYNEVHQNSNIASIGFASVGIRVDGSYNNIVVPKNTTIIENGFNSSGIAFTYGRDNTLDIEGNVEATSDDGVALRFDFGSNALSDLEEYRGSYRRVKTYDYFNGKLDKDRANCFDVPLELQGPLVKEVNLKGKLSSKRNAIYIDASAHVKKINFYDTAKVVGNILSRWNPYYNYQEKVFYASPRNGVMLDGKLVFDNIKHNYIYQQQKSLENSLKTKLIFGVKEKNLKKHYAPLLSYDADEKANISVEGNIVGNSFDMSSFGGHTHIDGYINVNRLYIAKSAVNINSPLGYTNYVNKLDLRRYSQLDFSNGVKDVFVVKQEANIDNNSLVCLDTDKNANIIDKISFMGTVKSKDGILNIDPGLSYPDIKALQSDPQKLYELLSKFDINANKMLRPYDLSSNFPKHVWYTQGDLGRSVRCVAKGCYLGDFVKSLAKSQEQLPTWRYILSIVGCILMIIATAVIFRKTKQGRFG